VILVHRWNPEIVEVLPKWTKQLWLVVVKKEKPLGSLGAEN